eukprot:m.76823 g.76823  ORF g.76823 m.76823 type:complete len:297 (+) comp14442_c2_seq5:81-971(+)
MSLVQHVLALLVLGLRVCITQVWNEEACQSRHGPVLVYNKIPKTGSTTLSTLLQRSSRHGFKAVCNQSMHQYNAFTEQQEREAIKDILTTKPTDRPVAHHQHSRWLDFEKHGYNKPLYLNLMRDPVARHTSRYYFLTQTLPKRHRHSQPLRRQSHLTINECFDLSDECWYSSYLNTLGNLMTAYFCGNHLDCRNGSTHAALERAKHNLRNEYTLVGLNERYHDTLRLLEVLLPDYFEGVVARAASMPHQRESKGYEPLAEHHRLKWRLLIANDIKLYRYTSELFQERVKACLSDSE